MGESNATAKYFYSALCTISCRTKTLSRSYVNREAESSTLLTQLGPHDLESSAVINASNVDVSSPSVFVVVAWVRAAASSSVLFTVPKVPYHC